LSVIQVAHFDLGCRCDLDAGTTRRVNAIPQTLTELCTDDSLFEWACVPGPYRKTLFVRLEVNLQGSVYKPRALDCPRLATFVAKWAGLDRYLNLHSRERSDPFAGQVGLRACGHVGGDG
jgi:hypothetical protein